MDDLKKVIIPSKPIKPNELVNYNIEYYETKSGNIHQMIKFDNVSDMVDCCTENAEKGCWDNKGYSFSGEDKRWIFGTDFPDLPSTYKALMEGQIPINMIKNIDKVTVSLYEKHPELFDIEANATKIKRKRVFLEYGDELNIDKYLSGDVEMWQSMTRRPVKQSLKIMINACLHCGHNSKEFQEGMIMVTAFLDILDKAGISNEVWYAPVSFNSSYEVEIAGVFCRIKSAEERLDVCKMLSCGAPGLFRHYTFRVWTNLLKGRPSSGLGQMVTDSKQLTLVKELNEFDVMINAKDTAEETFNIITNTLKELF